MIQRMSDENKIKFLESEGDEKPSVESAGNPQKTLKQLAEEQKNKKLSNKDNGLMTEKHIRSARTGAITDMGGSPDPKISSERSNSIWGANKIRDLPEDSQTRVKEQKEEIATNKRIAEQKRMDTMIEQLKKTDQTKGESVSPMSHLSGSKYYSPKNNMSIFDSEEFSRLADKTSGEKLSEDVQKKRSQKDESWKNSGKQLTSKDIANKLWHKEI